MNHIVIETNRYSAQKNGSKPLEITILDIKRYIGICMIMSYVNLPSIRDYWKESFGNQLIQQTMFINHFEKIKQIIHFAKNDDFIPLGEPGLTVFIKLGFSLRN